MMGLESLSVLSFPISGAVVSWKLFDLKVNTWHKHSTASLNIQPYRGSVSQVVQEQLHWGCPIFYFSWP